MIFPEALESAEEFGLFSRTIPTPLLANMTEFGRSPLLGFDELAALGYRAVLYPLTAFRVAMRAAEEVLAELAATGSQRGSLPRMMTRAALYERIGYDAWEERDRSFFESQR